jgi:CheY-like chemotaxis protein
MPRTILLVDDAVMFLEIQKNFLKMSTLKVQCARDGVEALGLTRDARPDLVIMDLHMPRMNGAECCAAIKKDPDLRSTPVIMTTSAGKAEDHALCRSAGCDFLMTKPFERGLFLDMVRRFIPELDRREPRIPFSAKIRFHAFRVNMTGTVMDLSARGIYVATEFKLETGTEIVLAFSLSEREGDLFQAKGVVRWTNSGEERRKVDYPSGFGLEFTAVAGESLSILQRYLARRGV